jgi:hypothetical protein
MRVRITKTLFGSIDGIQLSRLSKGQVYDVYTSLACYLLSEQMAEPAPHEEPTAILPVEDEMSRNRESADPKVASLPRTTAADRSRKNKKKR